MKNANFAEIGDYAEIANLLLILLGPWDSPGGRPGPKLSGATPTSGLPEWAWIMILLALVMLNSITC